MTGGRFMAVDADHFNTVIAELKRGKKKSITGKNIVFYEGDQEVGAHLSMSDTEYELGWMFFSGNAHPTIAKADECVGFVYDGAYCLDNLWDENQPPQFELV